MSRIKFITQLNYVTLKNLCLHNFVKEKLILPVMIIFNFACDKKGTEELLSGV